MHKPRLLLVLALLTALPAAQVLACEGTVSRDTLLGPGPHGEIRLASGGAVVLGDIRVGDDGEGVRGFLASHAGAAVEVVARAKEPDRWGRLPAAITLGPDTSRLDLAHALVARGLAVVDPSGRGLCDASLLMREEQARRAGRGLWREDRARPLPAENAAALLERVGEFAIVEGVVRGVGVRERSTFIDFDRAWEGSFTIIVPRRVWNAVENAGMEGRTLEGRRIRVRGIMQNWRGPAIELTAAELIEKLELRP